MTASPTRTDPPRTAREMVARGRAFLEGKGRDEARLDAELLVAHALGLDRLRLFLELDRPVDQAEIQRARDLLVRRGKGEPTAYLTGTREFYGRAFGVDAAVLVPRPETELLVDVTRELLAGREAPRLAELGTGSGCIAVTLALELEGAQVVASDVSAQALARARSNAEALDADVTFLEGDGIAPLVEHGPFDAFVSNPPYVDPADDALDADVRRFEPGLALFAPEGRPDHWVERCLDEALPLLTAGGVLVLELGHDQAPRVLATCASRGLDASVRDDLDGIGRVLMVRAPG